VAREASGMLLVADAGSSNPKLVRVDPVSGNRSIVSGSSQGTGTALVSPYALSVDSTGFILLTDAGLKAMLRIDPVSGNRTLLSGSGRGTGTAFQDIRGVVSLAGSLAVADAFNSCVFQVDQVSGNRTVLSGSSRGAGPTFATPAGLISEGNGKLLVLDYTLSALFRVDLSSGDRAIIASAASGSGPLFGTSPQFLTLRVNPLVSLESPRRLASGSFQFSFNGTIGTSYTIETSSNLTDWAFWTNIASAGFSNVITDASVPSNGRRFYRTVFTP